MMMRAMTIGLLGLAGTRPTATVTGMFAGATCLAGSSRTFAVRRWRRE